LSKNEIIMKKFPGITLLFLLVMNALHLQAQSPEKPMSVGIFIYEGVEILDFSGPSEVFAATNGFRPFLVAMTKAPVTSQGFIQVTPQYSIEDCPPTDILVFPGGATNRLLGEEKLINWIAERSKTNQFMMSVCTGAALLSKAGLLDGKEATTFHGFIPQLQEMTPKAKIHSQTRFVDNGQVVTTAGVSAGIDGALHVVSRIKGEAAAKATAKYMEYDKWQPGEGKVIESAFLGDIRQLGLEEALKKHQGKPSGIQPLYYAGEMTNLAMELLDSKPAQSEAIFRMLIKTSQPTTTMYDGMGMAWKKMGKSAPPDSRSFLEKLAAGEIAWAKKTHQELLKSQPDWLLFTEEDLNSACYKMHTTGKTKAAIEGFKWITELYPTSPNAWDSLSEAYEIAGEHELAISASEQCLAKLPDSGYEESHRNNLAKISKERIGRLKDKR